MLKAIALFVCLSTAVACGGESPDPFGADAAGGAGENTGGRGGAGGSNNGQAGGPGGRGGAGGAPSTCAGCWNGAACVLPAQQTIDLQGDVGSVCARVPLSCTGRQSAPCPTNTAPAMQLAYRGNVAYCCPADSCTYEACTPAAQ